MHYDEERSDSNDSNFIFEIEDDSVRKGFDQHEKYEFVQDLGLSKKESELLASRLEEKNLLEKERRFSTFEPEKMNFCIISLITSKKTLVTLVMSKMNDSTKI